MSTVLLAGLVGCIPMQNTAATAEYARQVTTASQRVASLESDLVNARTRVEQLEEFVRAQGRTEATKMENLDQVNAEITRMRGQIEVIQHTVDEMVRESDNALVDGERRTLHAEMRLAQLEEFLGVKPPAAPTDADMGLVRIGMDGTEATPPGGDDTDVPTDTDAPTTDTMVEVPDTAAAVLEAATGHMEAGRQGVARALLTRAKTSFPDAEEADEIQYRLAETHLNERDFKRAALAYKAVIDEHPGSSWASWAMLRQGECFAGLGNDDGARLFFDAVIQRYPKSNAAKEAKAKLAGK